MNNKPIFIYKNKMAFAWAGGRLLIRVKDHRIDFGDGGMSRGKFGHTGNFEHSILGEIHCNDTIFNFKKYNIIFDFNDLRNCKFLDKNKAKKKPKFYPTADWHFLRFFNKHYN